MRSSVHIGNKHRDILILGEELTQGLDDTTLIAEGKYFINFRQSGKRLVLILHCNGKNSFLFVNTTKIYKFKLNDSEIIWSTPRLVNISNNFTLDNTKKKKKKKIELKGSVNFFSVDYNAINTSGILDIRR